MGIQTSVRKFDRDGVRCIYNADRVTEAQVADMLADGAAALLQNKSLICETRTANSYAVEVGMARYFTKIYKPGKLYRRVLEVVKPVSHNTFDAGLRMLKADLPTPTPILAVLMDHNGKSTNILVTDYCDDAVGLDKWVQNAKKGKRIAIMDEVAHLLADFHSKGFQSNHLRSANILVAEPDDEGRVYWFIDLDSLSAHRIFTSSVFVQTVSRACFEFYEFLSPEERKYLMRACFSAALKQNIYKKPSDEEGFMAAAQSQISRRKRS